MKQKHSVTAEKSNITFNSGDLAGLAGGSVTMELGETNLFVSVTAATKLRPDQNWFPLTVDYREKFAAGQKQMFTGITITDPAVTEMLSGSTDGFWIDLEHNPTNLEPMLATRARARAAAMRAGVQL